MFGFAGETDMPSSIRLKDDDRILFIGDSITDAERHRQAYAPLGFGYVHFVGNLLSAKYPRLDLKLVNTGVSGDTVRELADRWERDCLAHEPDVLSVLIGINDVWRSTLEPDREASSWEQYEVTYDQLLLKAEGQCHCQIVLMEPFMFCSNPLDPVFTRLGPYLEVVRRLAARHHAVLVPLQRTISEEIVHVPAERWSQDMVHPYLWAHAWIAQRWLESTNL
jgi:lysophospholipase L1-like esterase